MRKTLSPAYLTAACCSGYYVMGLVISLIGAGLEAFAEQLSTRPTAVGSGFFFFAGTASFFMLFVVGPLIDRFGQKPVLIAGSLFLSAAMFLLIQARTLSAACALMFLVGTGSAGLNGGVNTLINHLHSNNRSRAFNLSNIFFGLGAVTLPCLAGGLLKSGGLFHLLIIASALSLIPALLFSLGSFPAGAAVNDFRLGEAVRALSNPLVALFALVIFFYVGLEASLGIWSRTAMIDSWRVSAPLDQFILAGYWGALITGRLLAGTTFKDIPSHTLVLSCSIGSAIGLGAFIFAPSVYLAAGALWFSGLCFAPIFPSTMGSAGENLSGYTGTTFSLLIAVGVLGAVVLSTSVGKIAASSSLTGAFRIILATSIMLLVSQYLLRRIILHPRQSG